MWFDKINNGNGYAYVAANPVSRRDPWGFQGIPRNCERKSVWVKHKAYGFKSEVAYDECRTPCPFGNVELENPQFISDPDDNGFDPTDILEAAGIGVKNIYLIALLNIDWNVSFTNLERWGVPCFTDGGEPGVQMVLKGTIVVSAEVEWVIILGYPLYTETVPGGKTTVWAWGPCCPLIEQKNNASILGGERRNTSLSRLALGTIRVGNDACQQGNDLHSAVPAS